MLAVVAAMVLEFFILAIPAYIIFKKLRPNQDKKLTKFSKLLNQDEALEYRGFLEGLADYLKDNNQFIAIFFNNPILIEYIKYFIDVKQGYFISKLDGHRKSAYEEYGIMLECYGEELFNKNEIMRFLSFGYGKQIYFTSHGFVHLCKWIRENGLFDTILLEIYSMIVLTNGYGMRKKRLAEIVQLFDDIRELSVEYQERFRSLSLDELIKLSQTSIECSSTDISSSTDASSSTHSTDNEICENDDESIADQNVELGMKKIIKQILAEASNSITLTNGDPSNLEDIVIKNANKIKKILATMTKTEIGDASNSSDSNTDASSDTNPADEIPNPESLTSNTATSTATSSETSSATSSPTDGLVNIELAKDIEQLDQIINTEAKETEPAYGILSAIYGLFGKSNYLVDDFGSGLSTKVSASN